MSDLDLFKLPFPERGEPLSWQEIADSEAYKSKSPEVRGKIRELFYAGAAKADPKLMVPELKHRFIKSASDYENKELVEAGQAAEQERMEVFGKKVPITPKWAERAMGPMKVAREAITPVLERVAPGFVEKYRKSAGVVGEAVGELVERGVETLSQGPTIGRGGRFGLIVRPRTPMESGAVQAAAEPAGEMAAGVSKFALDLPLQMTDPASLATAGAGGLLKAAGREAAESLGKKGAREGLKDLIAAPREASERLSQKAIAESGLDDLGDVYRSMAPEKPRQLGEAVGEVARAEKQAARQAAQEAAMVDEAISEIPPEGMWQKRFSEHAEDVKAAEIARTKSAIDDIRAKGGDPETEKLLSDSLAQQQSRPAVEFLGPEGRKMHAAAVQKAANEGLPVPERVFVDYPEFRPTSFATKGMPGTEAGLPGPVRESLERIAVQREGPAALKGMRKEIRKAQEPPPAQAAPEQPLLIPSAQKPSEMSLGMKAQPIMDKVRTNMARAEIGETVGRLYASGATPQDAMAHLGSLRSRYAGNEGALKTLDDTITAIGLEQRVSARDAAGKAWEVDFGAKNRAFTPKMGAGSAKPPSAPQKPATAAPKAAPVAPKAAPPPAAAPKALSDVAKTASNPVKAKIAGDIDGIIKGTGAPPSGKTSTWRDKMVYFVKNVADSNYGIKFKADFSNIFGGGWFKNQKGVTETYKADRGLADRVIANLMYDVKKVTDKIASAIKSATDKDLFNRIYMLKSMRESAENGVEYGDMTVRDVDEVLEALQSEMVAAGKSADWARINAAVETFAEDASTISLDYLVKSGLIDDATAALWKKKHKYYSFMEVSDEAAERYGVRWLAGEEGPVKMMDIFTQYKKTREGFAAMPKMDAIEQFVKYHMKKIVASEKKKVMDVAIKEFGVDIEKEAGKLGGMEFKRFKAPDGSEAILPREVVEFLGRADKNTTDLFHLLASDMKAAFRRGVLDLNSKYYFSMVRRDVFETLLRSKGSWTPAGRAMDKAVSKGIDFVSGRFPKLAEKLNLQRFKDTDYGELGSLLNPKYWIKAYREAANFGKGINKSKIAEKLAREGYTQTHDLQTALNIANAIDSKLPIMPAIGKFIKQPSKRHYAYVMNALNHRTAQGWAALGSAMKSWDDMLRHVQVYRNLKPEFRKNLLKMDEITDDMFINAPSDWRAVVRDTNLDFKQSGDGMRTASQIIPFLNPNIQDKYMFIEAMRDMPVTMATRVAGLLSAASAAYVAWKNNPASRYVSPQDEQRFIMIDTGVRVKDGNKQRPVVVPLGFIPEFLQPLWISAKAAIDIAYEKDPDLKKQRMADAPGDVLREGAGSWLTLGGPVLAPLEYSFNFSIYRKGPISRVYDKNIPPGLQASAGTENIYRAIGAKLDRSPDRIKYLARGILGSVPDYIAQIDALDKFAEKHSPIPQPTRWQSPGHTKALESLGVLRVGKYDKARDDMDDLLEALHRDETGAAYIIRERFREAFRTGSEEDMEAFTQSLKEFEGQLPKTVRASLRRVAKREATAEDLGGRFGAIPRRHMPTVMRAMERYEGGGQ